jgi:hypothetical protein
MDWNGGSGKQLALLQTAAAIEFGTNESRHQSITHCAALLTNGLAR